MTALECVRDAVLTVDVEGRVVEANAAACRILGRHELLGVEEARADAQRRDESVFPCDVLVMLVEDGSELLFTGHLKDLIQRRESEDAARRTAKHLQAASDRLKRFPHRRPTICKDPCAWSLPTPGS